MLGYIRWSMIAGNSGGIEMGKSFVAILLLVTFISSCGKATNQPPVPTSTSSPTKTATPTISPTATLPQPSMTPTSTEFPIPTKSDWELSQYATAVAEYDKIKAFPTGCKDLEPQSSLLSPDENWLAEPCMTGDFYILQRSGDARILISSDELFGAFENHPCQKGIYPLHWTNDNRYLYFTKDTGCHDSGDVPQLADRHSGPLFRLDIQIGKWSTLIDNPQSEQYYYFSFSPTDRRVVYGGGSGFTVLDLRTGDAQLVSPPGFAEIANRPIAPNNFPIIFLQTGQVTWSSDGLAFVFTGLETEINNNARTNVYSVYLYDIKDKSILTIITDTPERRLPLEWTADNILVIALAEGNYSYEPIPGHTLYYDINARSFIEPTPTP
jgi:hypothetical protein